MNLKVKQLSVILLSSLLSLYSCKKEEQIEALEETPVSNPDPIVNLNVNIIELNDTIKHDWQNPNAIDETVRMGRESIIDPATDTNNYIMLMSHNSANSEPKIEFFSGQNYNTQYDPYQDCRLILSPINGRGRLFNLGDSINFSNNYSTGYNYSPVASLSGQSNLPLNQVSYLGVIFTTHYGTKKYPGWIKIKPLNNYDSFIIYSYGVGVVDGKSIVVG